MMDDGNFQNYKIVRNYNCSTQNRSTQFHCRILQMNESKNVFFLFYWIFIFFLCVGKFITCHTSILSDKTQLAISVLGKNNFNICFSQNEFTNRIFYYFSGFSEILPRPRIHIKIIIAVFHCHHRKFHTFAFRMHIIYSS